MKSLQTWVWLGVPLALAVSCAGGPDSEKLPQPGPDYGVENAALASDKDDSASRPASITPVNYGDVKTTTFTRSAKWRAFSFAGKRGEKVDLYVDGLRGLDTVLYLYKVSRITGKPFGLPLASNDDTENPGWTVRTNTTANPLSSNVLAHELPEDRTYALVATTYRQWYAGSAEVVVKAQPASAEGRQCSGLIAYPPCPDGYFCEISVAGACNGADLPGYCKRSPSACVEIYAPVCGCDGKTYGNDCERQVAGAQLDHAGPCGNDGDVCTDRWPCKDGLACKNGTCRQADYCQTVADCTGLPHILCVGQWSCVNSHCGYRCGNVLPGGQVGDSCGSRGMAPCAAGLFCNFPASADCGATDAPGTCATKPSACIMLYQPVCGCDGQTYSNFCFANMAGTSVASQGACP